MNENYLGIDIGSVAISMALLDCYHTTRNP